MPISIGHYLNNMSKLTNQWSSHNYREPDRQRIYLKDIDCPRIWHDKLQEQIPPSVFYLNENTGELGGPGAKNSEERGAARAGDLMSSLPPAMRAENMMCYIGHEGTYTPAHREMCASLGQNLMVETSGTKDDEGKAGRPGSSIWFMTETKDRHLVSEYWLSTLGHDIEVEAHFAQINAWKAAPFKTYIVDQRAGDFILIPPLAPHQVWNRGTRTMKVAWNRTTVETLEMALHEALPRARMVCRDEQYKNKAMIYYTLEKYSGHLKDVQSQKVSATPEVRHQLSHNVKVRQLQKDFKRLFALYNEVLLSEMLGPVSTAEKRGQYLPYDSFVTCSYCRCNIFNRFLTCTSCVAPLANGEEDTYDICMECYAMGRSCSCLSRYKWVEQFPWQDLTGKHDAWRHQIIDFEGGVNEKSPCSLQIARKQLGKKTLAQVCQEQLKARPFVDPKKATPQTSAYARRHPGSAVADSEDKEVQVDADGHVKKSTSKKTRAEKLPKGWVIEHVSHYPEERWKVAECSNCQQCYSYGSLFRMFDLKPQTVMESLEWKCPACLKICSCGACRRKADMKPHQPTGTVLGHDTKKVADPRSVESLVNFSLPNLAWIKQSGDDHPHESRRLSRRIDEAERAKAQDPALDENYVDDADRSPPPDHVDSAADHTRSAEPDIAIDPMLLGEQASTNGPGARSFGSVAARGRSKQSQGAASGANGNVDRQEQRAAPIANMTGQDDHPQGFTSNGISYEYPDPTDSQPATTFQAHQFATPDTNPARTRRLETSILQSDVTEPLQASNNGQQLTQLELILEDAKHSDRFVSAEAKFTGKSLLVYFKVAKAALGAILARPPVPKVGTPIANGVRAGPPIILQSDFPAVASAEQPSSVRKRKTRDENDADFNTRKRKDRKSSTAQVTTKDTRKKSARYTEPSSESELELPEEVSTFTAVNKPKGPRPLPRYIAQRIEEDPVTPSNNGQLEEPLNALEPRARADDDPQLGLSAQSKQGRTSNARGELGNLNVESADVNTPSHLSETPATDRRNGRGDLSIAKGSRGTTRKAPSDEPHLEASPNKRRNTGRAQFRTAAQDPVQKLAEENRAAKMKASQWAENEVADISSDTDSSSGSVSPIKAPAPKAQPIATPKSIFSRPGMSGRKIKIVGSKKKPINGVAAPKA